MEKKNLEKIVKYFVKQDLNKAKSLCSKWLKKFPNDYDLNNIYASCLAQTGRHQEALAFFNKLLNASRADGHLFNNLANCYQALNNYELAISYYKRALALENNCEWQRNLGNVYADVGFFNKATVAYKSALLLGSNHPELPYNLNTALKACARFQEALDNLSLIQHPLDKTLEEVSLYISLNQADLAKNAFNSIPLTSSFSENQIVTYHRLARHLNIELPIDVVLKEFGDKSKINYKIMQLNHGLLESDALSNIENDKSLKKATDGQKASFYFALAKNYKKQDKKRWFKLLEKANTCKLNNYSPQKADFQSIFLRIRESYKIYENLVCSNDNKRPIFIIGMPRSGTTLVETILSNHSRVFAAGETRLVESLLNTFNEDIPKSRDGHLRALHYLDSFEKINSTSLLEFAKRYTKSLNQFSTTSDYVTDKMPHNFLHLGLLMKAFPNAKFIHCQRDPIATCLSIFEQNFGQFHNYSNSLETIGFYYLEYQKLMTFWQSVSGERLYSLSYEELVTNTEETLNKLLAHCELDKEENLTELDNSNRTIATASAQQATNNIYSHSLTPYLGLEMELNVLIDILK